MPCMGLDQIEWPKFRWIKMKSLSTNAAASLEERTGDPASVVGGDEGDDISDVIRLAGAAKRGVSNGVLLKVRACDAGSVGSLCYGQAGIYSIDANFLWSKLLCQDSSDGVDRTLGSGIDRRVGRRQFADHRADVDDASAF